MSAEITKTEMDPNLEVARGHQYFLQSQSQNEEQEEGRKMSVESKEGGEDEDEEKVKKIEFVIRN